MTVRYEKQGKVGIFTFDRGKVNAFTSQMHKEFYHKMDAFLRDSSVRVGIITGAGERAFCAGDDIKNVGRKRSPNEVLESHFRPTSAETEDFYPGWLTELRRLPRHKPIIGALNGPVVGQGFIFATNMMDLRIGTPNAFLSLPEIRYGMGGAGATTQLWRHFPPAVAMRMVLIGDRLSADDALRYGYYNEIVEQDQLMERALSYAEIIVSNPEVAVTVEMEGFYRSMDMTREDTNAFMHHLYQLQRVAHMSGGDASESPLDEDSPESKKREKLLRKVSNHE
jgi:enoyl-CoA hydratase/carnithine racemase